MLRATRFGLAVLLCVAAPCAGDVFIVDNTVDPGDGVCAGGGGCTMRDAILAANANPGTDSIHFDIPGNGPHLIFVQSALPAITETVSIDGSTQPGFAGTPRIEIAGDAAGVGADGLFMQGAQNTSQIGWLAVTAFDGIGIGIDGAGGVTVVGCFVGVTASGDGGFGNATGLGLFSSAGVRIGGTVPIQRNVVSANDGTGIWIASASSNTVIEGNFIGLDPSGTTAMPNTIGVNAAALVRVGGTVPGSRNVVSGNADYGIYVSLGGSDSTIQGNFIGTDATGTTAVPNRFGIWMPQGTDGVIIGGAASSDRNVISGNERDGVHLDEGSEGVVIRGNYIGTDVTGQFAMGNAPGVSLESPAAVVDNVIAGNSSGIDIDSNGSSITANRIGVGATGGAIGNAVMGIWIDSGYANNVTSNTIAHNGSQGVWVANGDRNWLSGNAIYDNGELGIDLGSEGVLPNDPGDADIGANTLLNAPVLTAASITSPGGTTVEVSGAFSGQPNVALRIELYVSSACDPSGYGEGETFVDFVNVSADESGALTFDVTLDLASPVVAGSVVTALAMDIGHDDTSEFSNCVSLEIGYCGDPDAGDCFAPNGTPGCGVSDCCAAVCALDPYCCETEWDQLCATAAAAMCAPPCPADLDGSGQVGFADLTMLLNAWGPCGPPCPQDLDMSGSVGFGDVTMLLAGWGECP